MKNASIKAKLTFSETQSGGRKKPVHSGYRSLLRINGHQIDYGFELTALDEAVDGEISLGTTIVVALSIWASSELPTLSAGQGFEIREGTKIVGHGEILALEKNRT
jgi:translation elongation factor EF-Tu-like GTPase